MNPLPLASVVGILIPCHGVRSACCRATPSRHTVSRLRPVNRSRRPRPTTTRHIKSPSGSQSEPPRHDFVATRHGQYSACRHALPTRHAEMHTCPHDTSARRHDTCTGSRAEGVRHEVSADRHDAPPARSRPSLAGSEALPGSPDGGAAPRRLGVRVAATGCWHLRHRASMMLRELRTAAAPSRARPIASRSGKAATSLCSRSCARARPAAS